MKRKPNLSMEAMIWPIVTLVAKGCLQYTVIMATKCHDKSFQINPFGKYIAFCKHLARVNGRYFSLKITILSLPPCDVTNFSFAY